MDDQKHTTTSVTFEIDNFSEKESVISLENFSSGGCEWFVKVFPKGDRIEDHLSLFLYVGNRESLRVGWKRRACVSFLVLNHSLQELCGFYEPCQLFCAELLGWGFDVPLEELREIGALEKNKLILEVQVTVFEAVDEGDVTGNEMLEFKGFHVPYSKVSSVGRLLRDHQNIAKNVREKDQSVKTAYMNDLLGLVETLNKPPYSLSETELSNAHSELIKLTEAGFELDWLKLKLDEILLEKKKPNVARAQESCEVSDTKDWLHGLVHSWAVRLGFADVGKDKKIN